MTGSTRSKASPTKWASIRTQCRVLDCNADLSSCSKYAQKKHICHEHLKADAVQLRDCGNSLWRFCQQCGKFERLEMFSGAKRSCRESLAKRRNCNDRDAANHRQCGRRMRCSSSCRTAATAAKACICSQMLPCGNSCCRSVLDATAAAASLAGAFCAAADDEHMPAVAASVDMPADGMPSDAQMMSDTGAMRDCCGVCYARCAAHRCSCNAAGLSGPACSAAAPKPCADNQAPVPILRQGSFSFVDASGSAAAAARYSAEAGSQLDEGAEADLMQMIENELRAAAAVATQQLQHLQQPQQQHSLIHQDSLISSSDVIFMPKNNANNGSIACSPTYAAVSAAANNQMLLHCMPAAGQVNCNPVLALVNSQGIEGSNSARLAALSSQVTQLQQELFVLQLLQQQMAQSAHKGAYLQGLQLLSRHTHGSTFN